MYNIELHDFAFTLKYISKVDSENKLIIQLYVEFNATSFRQKYELMYQVFVFNLLVIDAYLIIYLTLKIEISK